MIALMEQLDGGMRQTEVREPPPPIIEHIGTLVVGGRVDPRKRRFVFVERRVWNGELAAFYREEVITE